MLTFDMDASMSPSVVYLDKETAKKQFLFNINGSVHGQPVFSEVIFYMMKGGKLVNCLLQKINGRLISEVQSYVNTGSMNPEFPDKFNVKIKDLPKSFGCQVSLFVDKKTRHFGQLNRRLSHLVNDSTGQYRQICDAQPYPFTVSNL